MRIQNVLENLKMIQIKIFCEIDLISLEYSVNEWLYNHPNIRLDDIKTQTFNFNFLEIGKEVYNKYIITILYFD